MPSSSCDDCVSFVYYHLFLPYGRKVSTCPVVGDWWNNYRSHLSSLVSWVVSYALIQLLGETDFSWAILGMYYVYRPRLYNSPVAFDLVPIPIKGLLLYLHQLKQKLLRQRLLDLLVPGSFPDQFHRVGREVIKNKLDFLKCFFYTRKSK